MINSKFRALFNASVAVYDPFINKIVEIIEFPGIAHNPEFHIGGLKVDQRTGLISIVVNAGAAFNTNGQDLSGTNYIIQWDATTKEILY